MDEMSRLWRDECTLRPNMTYLNVGTMAPTLKTTHAFVRDLYVEWMGSGPGAAMGSGEANAYLDMMAWNDRARHKVAAWMETSPRSVAIIGNATDGINLSLASLGWKQGDRILTTGDEHEALTYPLQRLVEHYGVIVDVVPFPDDGHEEEFIKGLRSAMRAQTKLIAFSSVSHRSGLALRVEDILSELDKGEDQWVLVDGSHAAGTQTPLLVQGIDFYVFPGHKWLFAPVGTGVLWVSPRVLDMTDSLFSGAAGIDQFGNRLESHDGAWRYEYGTRDWSKAAGLTKVLDFRMQWPEGAIVAHYHDLTAAFRDGYTASGSTIRVAGSGPVVSIKASDAAQISQWLWQHERIYVKADGKAQILRVSVPPWLTMERASKVGYQVGLAIAQMG